MFLLKLSPFFPVDPLRRGLPGRPLLTPNPRILVSSSIGVRRSFTNFYHHTTDVALAVRNSILSFSLIPTPEFSEDRPSIVHSNPRSSRFAKSKLLPPLPFINRLQLESYPHFDNFAKERSQIDQKICQNDSREDRDTL